MLRKAAIETHFWCSWPLLFLQIRVVLNRLISSISHELHHAEVVNVRILINKRWDIEIGSPREFFREIGDAFIDLGIGISKKKDPSLTNMTFGKAAEFDGIIESGIANYRIYKIPWIITGIIMTVVSIWILDVYGRKAISYLSSPSPLPVADTVLVLVGVFLLVIGLSFIGHSFPVGQITIIAQLSGEAYLSKASATPDEIVSHERAGIYSRARLELFVRVSQKAPAELLQRVERNALYLEERFNSVISKYKILRDDMLVSSKDTSPGTAPLAPDTRRPPPSAPLKVRYADSSNHAVDDYKYCMKCNAKIARSSSVCSKCGTPQFS